MLNKFFIVLGLSLSVFTFAAPTGDDDLYSLRHQNILRNERDPSNQTQKQSRRDTYRYQNAHDNYRANISGVNKVRDSAKILTGLDTINRNATTRLQP